MLSVSPISFNQKNRQNAPSFKSGWFSLNAKCLGDSELPQLVALKQDLVDSGVKILWPKAPKDFMGEWEDLVDSNLISQKLFAFIDRYKEVSMGLQIHHAQCSLDKGAYPGQKYWQKYC